MPRSNVRPRHCPAYGIFLLAGVLACARPAAGPVREIARLDHPPLEEVSGIARSSRPDVFWVHNDSGHEARIFAVTLDGRPVVPDGFGGDGPWPGIAVRGAENVDWEDIAFSAGRLYVADTGNNDNDRRDLGVYELAEPDPFAARSVPVTRFLPLRYPDQTAFPGDVWYFDCEALFVADGKLHFLTKHRLPGPTNRWDQGTKLYRLDSEHTDRDNVLTLVGRRDDILLPTAADLSPDGRRLAVLTYTTVWLFERPGADGDWLAAPSSRLGLDRERMGRANEAITWKNAETLLIANEGRRLFALDVAAFPAPDARPGPAAE